MGDVGKDTSMSKLGKAARAAGKGLAIAGTAAAGLAATVAGMGLKGGLSRALDTEDAEILMRQLGASTEDVDKAIASVDKTFQGTPFKNPDGFNFSAQLQASGKALDQIERDLRTTSNVTALTLDKDFEQVSDIFLQMSAQGQVTAQDMNRLATQGFPIREILGEALEMSGDELMNMVSSGELTYDQLMEVLDGVEDLDGAAENMGDSTRVAWKNFLEGFSQVGEAFVKNFLPPMREGFQALYDLVSDLIGPAEEWGEALGESLQEGVDWLVDAIDAFRDGEASVGGFLDSVSPLLDILGTLWDLISQLREPLWEVASVLGDALADILPVVADALLDVGDVVADLLADLLPVIADVLVDIADVAADLVPPLADLIMMIGEFLQSALEEVQPFLVTLVELLGDALAEALPELMPLIELLIEFLVDLFEALEPLLPSLGDLLEALIPLLDPFMELVEELLPPLVELLEELLPVAIEIVEDNIDILIDTIVFIIDTLTNWLDMLFEVRDGLMDFANGNATVGDLISDTWETVTSFIGDQWSNIVNTLGSITSTMTQPFKDAFNAIASYWNSTVGSLSFTVPDWVPGMGGKGWSPPNIPMLAEGGIVDRATLAMIGEAGPEAVIPLDKLGNMGGGTYNITVQAGVGDPISIGREVMRYIKEYERAGGR